jgi:hypothetical protein
MAQIFTDSRGRKEARCRRFASFCPVIFLQKSVIIGLSLRPGVSARDRFFVPFPLRPSASSAVEEQFPAFFEGQSGDCRSRQRLCNSPEGKTPHAREFFIPLSARGYAIFGPRAHTEFRHDSCNTAPRWRDSLPRGGAPRIDDSRLRGNDMFMIYDLKGEGSS